jgi:hypothetical protein
MRGGYTSTPHKVVMAWYLANLKCPLQPTLLKICEVATGQEKPGLHGLGFLLGRKLASNLHTRALPTNSNASLFCLEFRHKCICNCSGFRNTMRISENCTSIQRHSLRFLRVTDTESVLNGYLSPRHGGWRRRPPDIDGSCEYIEKIVTDTDNGWSSSLGDGRGG